MHLQSAKSFSSCDSPPGGSVERDHFLLLFNLGPCVFHVASAARRRDVGRTQKGVVNNPKLRHVGGDPRLSRVDPGHPLAGIRVLHIPPRSGLVTGPQLPLSASASGAPWLAGRCSSTAGTPPWCRTSHCHEH